MLYLNVLPHAFLQYMQHHTVSSSLKRSTPTSSVAVPSSNPAPRPHSLTPTHSTISTPKELRSASASPHTHSTHSSSPSKSRATEPQPHCDVVPVPVCPSPIPEIPNDDGVNSGQMTQNGIEMSSSGSPIRGRWSAHIRTRTRGSDSSVSGRMSSREPSSSPQTVPKKRSFTITSIENGRFALNNDLSPVLSRAEIGSDIPAAIPSSPPPRSPSPVPIITTTLSPTSTSPSHSSPLLIANGVSQHSTHPIKHIPNGAHPSNSPNGAHLNPSQNSDRESTPDIPNPSNSELSPSNLSTSDLDRPLSELDLQQSETVTSSVENLLDEGPSSTAKESKWKRKLFKRKKKNKDKKKVKTQTSLQEAVQRHEMGIKPRSNSDVIDEYHIVECEEEKRRSQSHDELDSKCEENSVRTSTKKRRSNSIMAKYTALVEEQKKMVGPPIDKIPMEPSLPPFDNVQVKDMDSKTFQESLFCKQLEYKLRAALQNVHTPLTSSPIYQQLRAVDSKHQVYIQRKEEIVVVVLCI